MTATPGAHRYEVAAPDGGWGWAVVFASFLATSLCGGSIYSFGVLYVAYLDEFERSKAATAWIGSIFTCTFTFAMSASLGLSHKIGHRATVMLAGLVSSIGLALTSFASNIYSVYITHGLITGFGFGMGYMPGIDIISVYFKKRLSLALGLGMAGTGAGHFVLSISGQALFDIYGLHGTLMILSASVLNLCVAGALLRPLGEHHTAVVDVPVRCDDNEGHEIDDTNSQAVSDKASVNESIDDAKTSLEEIQDIQSKSTVARSRKKLTCKSVVHSCISFMYDIQLMTEPVFLAMVFIAMLQTFGQYAGAAHMVMRVRDYGISDSKSAVIPAVMGLAQMIGRPLYGFIGNCFSIRPTLIYSVGMSLCAITTAVSVLVKSFTVQLIYVIVFGMSLGGYKVYIPIVVSHFFGPKKLGYGTTFLSQVHGVLGLLVSPLIGWMRDVSGGYDGAFWVISAAYLLGALVSLLLPLVDKLVKRRRSSMQTDDS
ncbi:monocarboxylate transporter 13-like [Ptychodera flava]|uniref:monocarboxylate transporter 13-like n=1 Tax=Ptychodera flava TaxID=63121 RepID=UPI00396AB11C